MASHSGIDLSRLRAWFIKSQLQRALSVFDPGRAAKAAQEFRRYTEWFHHSLPEPDRDIIAMQLAMLDKKLASQRPTSATAPKTGGAAVAVLENSN